MKLKTIEITAKEWRDKHNGNSYFSALVALNKGKSDAEVFRLEYQYGYGDQYQHSTIEALEARGIVRDRQHYSNGGSESLSGYCDRKGIILFAVKIPRCLKREVREWGEDKFPSTATVNREGR